MSSSPSIDAPAPPSLADPKDRFYESQALRLHYADWGNEAAPPLILSWKFDDYQRARAPYRLSPDDHITLWSRITCPALLLRGKESFLPDPETAGVLAYFKRARLVTIVGAGHWLHHDKLDEVLGVLRPFLGI